VGWNIDFHAVLVWYWLGGGWAGQSRRSMAVGSQWVGSKISR
jgi:hypothetical protein